ncbi:hypothetical protein J3R82DRAFT_1724 [Butyriboletus roseoflavus]|nr:hypothetical protein J3R82DRAFT_1724 [Butyriboletus roseoflavus]
MAAYTRNQKVWRPRGGKPTNYRASQTGGSSASASFVLKDLDERVATLSVDATGYASEHVRLRHVKSIASYSWIDAPVPTIVVPGSPWIWAEERPPVKKVPLDVGVQYIHHNASKMGNHSPMLPLFAAIDALHDDFLYKDLDLVTDRNSFRKLLRYIDNVGSEDNFRIDIDLVGKTCLFTRQEESATLSMQNTGYGNEYLNAATRVPPGCEKMLDHHRIITYKFGTLNILLGFTADACVEQKTNDDDFLASFSSLSIGGKAEKTTEPDEPESPAGLDIKFTPSRSLIPQSDLIEVKTRSIYREPNWREIYPQLYLSQTAWLYMAKHAGGDFEPVEKISLTGEQMKPYAEMMEGSLGKLKNLLKVILKAVREQGEGVPLSLVRQGETLSLWIRKEGSGKPLGEEIRSKFKRGTLQKSQIEMPIANIFSLPTYLLSLAYSTLTRLTMLSITTSQPPPLDLMFPQELISPEVSKQLPPELTIRPLASTDYKRGHLDVLSVLTVVSDTGEAAWVNQFHAMRAAPRTYYTLVIVDNASDRIVGVGCVFIERKFLRGLGSVGHIEDIAVDKSQQGKKLGQRIIQALTHISENSGCYKTILNCSDANIPFYEKCGYTKKENEMAKYAPERSHVPRL